MELNLGHDIISSSHGDGKRSTDRCKLKDELKPQPNEASYAPKLEYPGWFCDVSYTEGDSLSDQSDQDIDQIRGYHAYRTGDYEMALASFECVLARINPKRMPAFRFEMLESIARASSHLAQHQTAEKWALEFYADARNADERIQSLNGLKDVWKAGYLGTKDPIMLLHYMEALMALLMKLDKNPYLWFELNSGLEHILKSDQKSIFPIWRDHIDQCPLDLCSVDGPQARPLTFTQLCTSCLTAMLASCLVRTKLLLEATEKNAVGFAKVKSEEFSKQVVHYLEKVDENDFTRLAFNYMSPDVGLAAKDNDVGKETYRAADIGKLALDDMPSAVNQSDLNNCFCIKWFRWIGKDCGDCSKYFL